MSKKKTIDEFVKESNAKHCNKYDYSFVEYINNKTKVKIICPIHGEFKQAPDKHLSGKGCIKCGFDKTSSLKRKSINNFIKEANIIHNNKYIYSFVEYSNAHTKVKIICPIHGEFFQTPHIHLQGSECPVCGSNNSIKSRTKTKELFIKEALEIHGDRYDYSLVDYKGIYNNIDIICTKHGVFSQTPHNHLSGNGCQVCNSSKGELYINNFLTSKNKKFETQKTFDDCKYIYKLKFDFFLSENNIAIEYNGRQHYEPVAIFGGEDEFIKIQKRDEIKRQYCIDNNIRLIEIRYDEDIRNILEQSLL